MYQVTEAKKTKRIRHDYSPEQLAILLAEHSRCPYPTRERRKLIARQVGVPETSILVSPYRIFSQTVTFLLNFVLYLQYWFQNRRRADRNLGKSASPKVDHRSKPYDRPVAADPGNHSQTNYSQANYYFAGDASNWTQQYYPEQTDFSGSSANYTYSPQQNSPQSQSFNASADADNDVSAFYNSMESGSIENSPEYYTSDAGNGWQGWYPTYPETQTLPSFEIPFPADQFQYYQQDGQQWSQQQPGNCYSYSW
jgi:hypothetical protein